MDLRSEAEAALRKADPLCVGANSTLIATKSVTEQSTILWSQILFLRDATQDQLQSMGNLCVLLSSAIKKANSESSSRLKRLIRSNEELNAILTLLNGTRLDPAIAESGNPSLYQFVNDEDVTVLKSQIDDYGHSLRKGLQDLQALPEQLQRELQGLREKAPEPPADLKNAPKLLAEATDEKAPLAQEMARLLDSLTRHYDLCSEIPNLNEKEKREALEVATTDQKLVQGAISRMNLIKDIFDRAHEVVVDLHRRLMIEFEASANFFHEIEAFTAHALVCYVSQIREKQEECAKVYDSVDHVTREVQGLTSYFKLFKKAYSALVIEIVRRRQAQDHLYKVLRDANASLQEAHDREFAVRQDFCSNYGEFLPKGIWNDIDSQPHLYVLDFEEEKMPNISKDSLAEALKDLNSSTKRS